MNMAFSNIASYLFHPFLLSPLSQLFYQPPPTIINILLFESVHPHLPSFLAQRLAIRDVISQDV